MTRDQKIKHVLISQHATVTHYRVRFYELLEQRRPKDWDFTVVFDTKEADRKRIYLENINWKEFRFPILDAPMHILRGGTRGIIWQSFFLRARKFDAIITDSFVAHLTYLATNLWRLTGSKRAIWGHTRDRQTPEHPSVAKRAAERFKRAYFKTMDYFFAYTAGEAANARAMGFPADRITVLNNTIDTVAQRAAYLDRRGDRDKFRAELGLAPQNKTLLYVGRLINDKRIDFLADAFEALYKNDPDWRLIIVGDGPMRPVLEALNDRLPKGVLTLCGAVTKTEKLAPIYIAADMYIITGAIGLAPLQAMCFDLPAIAFENPLHGPEIEYLTSENSTIFPRETTAQGFADAMPDIFNKCAAPEARAKIYPSIAHLTIENMVDHFITGTNDMFEHSQRIGKK